MENLLAVTAIGADRAGLIRDLSQVVTDSGNNILESRMLTLGSEFAIMMLVQGNWHTTKKVEEALNRLATERDLTVTVRGTSRRETPPQAAPYTIDVVTLDQEGIVMRLSDFWAQREMEIAEMNTRSYRAPHTGAAMFAVQMVVNVPRGTHVAGLREEFHVFCDEQNLDAVMEPAHG